MSRKKFTPCPNYNTSKLEHWLNGMAHEGFLLEKDGYRNTYANFTEAEKQEVFHRIWPKDGLNTYREANEHRKNFGWEFVATAFDFDIYRAYNADALKIDGDDINKSFIKKAAKRCIAFSLLKGLLSFVTFAFIFILMPYVIISAQSGLLMALIILAILTVEAVNGIKKIRTLSKFRKGITASYEKETDWKKSKIKNQIFNFTSLILLIIFAFLLMWLKTDSSVPASLPYDTSEIPFATVIDFTDDKASYSTEKRYNLNIYEKWETPVAKTNYEWSESAKIKVRGGNEIAYGITVDYHDTIHPAVAKIIAKLYILEARFTPYAFAYFEESPALGFDYEVMYRTEAGDKVYVLQQDCRIISFSVGCFGEIPEEFDSDEFDDKCVKIIADSIKE